MSSDNHPRAQTVAQYFLEARSEKGSSSKSLISQMSHRIELVKSWGIEPGSRVLELGCGQGDCTVVLADTVGEKGHVDAVDPGAPDYGQFPSYPSHISKSEIEKGSSLQRVSGAMSSTAGRR